MSRFSGRVLTEHGLTEDSWTGHGLNGHASTNSTATGGVALSLEAEPDVSSNGSRSPSRSTTVQYEFKSLNGDMDLNAALNLIPEPHLLHHPWRPERPWP